MSLISNILILKILIFLANESLYILYKKEQIQGGKYHDSRRS